MATPLEPVGGARLIRRGAFARLWWAGLIGSTGDWITIFASLALGSQIAGKAGILVVIVSRIFPALVFGAIAGVVADRMDRRKLIVVADVGRGMIVPLLAFADSLAVVVGINLVMEFLSLLGQSPRAAIVPRLVARPNIVTANGLMLGAAYGTIPVGAGLNWLLGFAPEISLGGAVPEPNQHLAAAFFVDALTFLLSGIIVATIAGRAGAPKSDRSALDVKGSFRDLADGAVFLWRHRAVRRVVSGMAAALLGSGGIIVLGLDFVNQVLGADAQGFFGVVAALGFGAATGIGVVSLYSERLWRRDVVFALSTFATGVGLASAALTDTVPGASAWLFVMGLGAGAAYVMGLSHLHEAVADEMRGRIFAALFTLMRVGLFVSMALVAPAADLLSSLDLPRPLSNSTRAVLVTGGLIIMASGLATLWSVRAVFRRPKLGERTRLLIEETTRASGTYPGRRSVEPQAGEEE